MLGSRSARSGLEQPATVQQWHDRQHPCTGAKLEDREQVGQVISQDVPGDRNRVFSAADAFQSELHGIVRSHDAYIESGQIMVEQILIHLLDNFGVVTSAIIQPEDGGRTACPALWSLPTQPSSGSGHLLSGTF